MQHNLTLVACPSRMRLGNAVFDRVRETLAAFDLRPAVPVWLAPDRAADLPLALDGSEAAPIAAALRRDLDDLAIDLALLPTAGRRKRLLISDMDSTIVDCETLDDLAGYAGVGDEVAAITWQSMNGEVEFVDALVRRVAMLEGLPAAMLEAAFERVRLVKGARILVRTMRAHGAHTVLVSGGFTYFTSRVAKLVGFHDEEANTLEVAHGRLTGRIVPPIINRDGKVDALHRVSGELGIPIADTVSLGDGANDLGMIAAAGLGVAYRGKPAVAAAAQARIDRTDLTALLFYQGYRIDQFAL